MKSLKYLLFLVACFNLQTVIGKDSVENKDVISKDVHSNCESFCDECVVVDQERLFEDFLKNEIINQVDTVAINLSVKRDQESYNEEVWMDIKDLAKIFNDTFNNLEDDDSWIDELQNLVKTIYELVKDEKSINGNLDISLHNGDKSSEDLKLLDGSNELLFSFVVKRHKEEFNQEKWNNVVDSIIELARDDETSERSDELSEEFLSRIIEVIRLCHDFSKDEKLKI